MRLCLRFIPKVVWIFLLILALIKCYRAVGVADINFQKYMSYAKNWKVKKKGLKNYTRMDSRASRPAGPPSPKGLQVCRHPGPKSLQAPGASLFEFEKLGGFESFQKFESFHILFNKSTQQWPCFPFYSLGLDSPNFLRKKDSDKKTSIKWIWKKTYSQIPLYGILI